MEDVFGMSKTDVLLGRFELLSEAEKALFSECARRLTCGEPLQYVVGTAPFGNLTFEVTPATLIPRPETLELVEWIVAEAQAAPSLRLLDIGTGSGCIAISLGTRLPQAKISAWDISEEALNVAKRNAERNGVGEVHICVSDGFKNVDAAGFEIILSNPPYQTDFSVAKSFIEKGFNRLKAGGWMHLVVKREKWYLNKMRAVFGGARSTEVDGYYIISAQRRSASRAK
jgi:HemK-like putative methylase